MIMKIYPFLIGNKFHLKYRDLNMSWAFHSKYLSILTSRGCPYPCKFCVVPKQIIVSGVTNLLKKL